MHWNLMNDKKFGSIKLLKLKYRSGDQIIQTFCKIFSHQKLGRPSLICRYFKKSTPESCRMHWNLMNDEENEYLELLKLKYRRWEPNNSEFLRNWFSPEIRSPLLNMQKFEDFEKITPESWRMHWHLMNDEEFGCIKFLKLKYRRVDQIIHTFRGTGSPQKVGPPL